MQNKPLNKKKAEPVLKESSPNSSNKGGIYFVAGIIAVLTFIVFSPALRNGLVNWDDNFYVFENRNLAKPLTEAVVFFFQPHSFIGNYIPVTMITYALEYHFAGLDAQFFHTINVLIHIVNVLLVFWFIYSLSCRKTMVAGLVALFFGIHPMHVESVAWVAELKDVMYSAFFLGGLICYYKYTIMINEPITEINNDPGTALDQQLKKNKQIRFIGLAFIFFVLSVLSKPAAVTFPVVLLLIDFYNRRKADGRLWLEKIPFLIVSVVFGIIAINTQIADKLLHDYYPFGQRLLFACHSLMQYIIKMFLPFNLSIFYPYPKMTDGHLSVLYYVAPVLVIATCIGVYRSLKYGRLIAFGFLFFLVNIALVLQLISVGDAIFAERYTYIPYIGLLFILAMGFDQFYNSVQPNLVKYKSTAISILAGLTLVSAYITYDRCSVWLNDDTIATDLLEKYPDDRLALNNKGFILYLQKRYNESIVMFNKAISMKQDYVMAYINLVNSYLALNDYDNAMKTTDNAMKNAPPDFNVLNTKGFLTFRNKQYEDALKYYKQSIALKNDNISGYLYLAECYYTMKDYANWELTLDQGLKFAPDNYVLLNNKGYALFVKKNYTGAIPYFKSSLKINPDYTTANANLNDCYKALGGNQGK